MGRCQEGCRNVTLIELSCEMRRGSGLSVGFALVVASIPNSWRNLLSVPGLACVALLQVRREFLDLLTGSLVLLLLVVHLEHMWRGGEVMSRPLCVFLQ
ncbi:uncharacterized protein [Physcomitrium patens]|uniref:Uncharacterized protein n=1 Tax=Physcomitrium patens TaxID=3218 RepID=A0A2K1IYH3_PHYPA|nr:uncharacterized protein LOC112295859 isoform X2 [Physcomitrium patens]PNR34321.1 hypothetical protein PHYPA_024138 [Physcomitrium patens]|eukprot:XP_024403637.1 uncharacterized protein LOC112295859 isoform X2 [Physcomitrella patens]